MCEEIYELGRGSMRTKERKIKCKNDDDNPWCLYVWKNVFFLILY